MYIILGEKVLSTDRITTVEIDRTTLPIIGINYLFGDGDVITVPFYDNEEKTAEEQIVTLMKDISEKDSNMLLTVDNRLVNVRYLKEIEKDILNPLKVVYTLYGGKPVKEELEDELAVDAKIDKIKKMLKARTEDTNTLELLGNYYTRNEIDEKIGDIERMLRGI